MAPILEPIAVPKTTKYKEVDITGDAMLCMSVRNQRASSNR
jgi:hypothetical protein